MDWIDRDRLVGLWERSVTEEPGVAYRMGPPCWLVADEAGGDKDIHAAGERVRARYFRADGSPKMSTVLSTAANVHRPMSTVCSECGVKPAAAQKTRCWGCIKKASRANKGDE